MPAHVPAHEVRHMRVNIAFRIMAVVSLVFSGYFVVDGYSNRQHYKMVRRDYDIQKKRVEDLLQRREKEIDKTIRAWKAVRGPRSYIQLKHLQDHKKHVASLVARNYEATQEGCKATSASAKAEMKELVSSAVNKLNVFTNSDCKEARLEDGSKGYFCVPLYPAEKTWFDEKKEKGRR